MAIATWKELNIGDVSESVFARGIAKAVLSLMEESIRWTVDACRSLVN